ncbi:putative anti-sigma factor antagonist BtrV [Novipirellula galeiformis]|uniref:Putative anti-sigma factor antagonist BtrV n=1 Tax=Novipirellula galeiformis TaxID=2528004 RepID=A0A5C6CKQ2_9BACT|nr:STAS domain-containing protein [Novipirellula galeiformis]TWU25002.1 putative anti-sigma factor antagonist BtrV [Novipirellula galeiformis]
MSSHGSVPPDQMLAKQTGPTTPPQRESPGSEKPLVEQTVCCSTSQLNSLKTARQLSDDLVGWINAAPKPEPAASKPRPTLNLDLGDVDWLSSVGINELIQVNRKARKVGVKFVLTEVGDSVREVFELTRLERMFHVVSSAPAD